MLGVLALIPEFVGTFLDIFFTGTVARHLACSATCTLREAKFEPNKCPGDPSIKIFFFFWGGGGEFQ